MKQFRPEDFENRSRKANLAKLLASENISVVHKNIPTAYFDVENRILGLPNWDNASKDVFDLLVGHEVGHALYTPSERQSTFIESVDDDNAKAVHSYINVIEDARIERKIKRKFAGLRKNFYKGYQELLERDFFGTATRSTDSYGLIDRINLHYKVGNFIDVPFSDDEQTWLERIDNAETFESVLGIVRDLYNSEKSETDNHDSGSDSDDVEYDNDSEDFGDDHNKSDSSDDGSDDDSGSDTDDGSDDDSGSDTDDDAKTSDSDDGDDVSGGGGKSSGSVPNAETETALADSIADEFVAEDSVESVYGSVPNVDSAKFVKSLSDIHSELSSHYTNTYRTEYLTFKKSVTKTVNYLVKEFELKKNAESLARASVAKTGVIDINKLHSYKFNDDLFKRVTTVPNGKNHGLLLFVDWSSSFAGSIGSALERVIEIALFCKKVGIPFDIYAFSDYDINDYNVWDNSYYEQLAENYKIGNIVLGNIRLLHLISGSVKSNAFDTHLENVYSLAKTWKKSYYGVPHSYNLGGTPLNECIILANDVVAKFRARYGVEIINTVFLTDGESSTINGVFNPDQQISTFGTGSHWNGSVSSILEDKVTGKNYSVSNRIDVTDKLLVALSDRHNVNTIGYFIGNSRKDCTDAISTHAPKKSGQTSWNFKGSPEYKEYLKELNSNKFISLDHNGYTEFFIIKGGKDLDVEDSGFNVEDGLSKRKLATAFKKHSKSKLENRVLLSRFIELIA